MATAQVDVPRLAAYVSLPVDHLTTLSTAPSPELVSTLFAKLAEKATQHEQLAAQKLRTEVELENVIRASEQKARLHKANFEKAQNQVTELQQQVETEQASRQTLATELQTIKSSTLDSSAELTTLQSRITSLEASNRDTLALLESKSRAHDGLAQELAAKHQKTVELRKEVSDLEDKLRAASTTATTAKFREQALEQEVESLKRSNDYLDTELKTRNAEFSKFRKDKNARISELQRQHEDNTTAIESLQRTEKALRSRAADLEQKTEDYLSQIQQVKEDLTRQEESFRSELETATRLQELMKEQADTEKSRRADLQEQFENVQDEAREEFAKIEEEMRTVQEDKDTAERRISELEAQVDRLESDISTVSAQVNVVGTPRFNGSVRPGSAPRTPVRNMSPSAPGSAMRGSVSYTQLVTEFHEVRKERDSLRRRNDELCEQVDEMHQAVASQKPELEQMMVDHENLKRDVGDMSALIESMGKDKDAAKKEARKHQGQVVGLVREGEILRQQLRDLSSQIKVLLLEVNARDQGQESFTPDERVRLEQLARGEDVDRDYNNDTDQFISQNLVSFKNVVELQAQNERLLRVTRELGEKMEGEEAQARQTQAAQDHEEVQELRQKYERVKDEMKSLMTQSQAYIRERDIFRRMLSHRGQLPPQSDIESTFGQSVNGGPPITPARNGAHASVEMSPASKDMADYNKLIKEMQSHFDGYKQESASERLQLKDQVSDLSTKNGELRNEIARKGAEVSLASGRYEMLQGNYEMLKNENGELQKRTQAASDRATQQDLRVQAVAEELVETRTTMESLRNESANLKAEKEFWKTVEKRITDDNQSLIVERDRLNTLNINLQNLLNEREHSDSESRRRLQTQIENLETEIQITKRKLSETEEEAKKNSLRREFDAQQAQTRIDDLVKTIGTTREELSGAKATRDQLQLRVDELTIELRSAEERLQVLSRPAAESLANDNAASSADQEQELALQVSELKRDLDLAKREFASAEEQIQQYKQISQGSEEELQSLNDSHDQYRQEMDQLLADKEARVEELEQKIETMRREADESTTELETLRTDKEGHERALREQQAQMDAELTRLKDTAERAETAAQFHQEDLKAQAEIARQAQENYDTELQKHAEASKALQAVRTELNEVRLDLVEVRSARDAAQSGLSQAEENWSETKSRYENEIAEVRSRRDDASRQNKLLHEQLEKVNSQMAEFQRARAAGGLPSDSNNTAGSDDSNLQELIRYLRQEKEIVDIQYEQANREAKRFRQQLEQTQSQLEDARLKLSQQLRSEEDRERSTLNHNKLLDTINELNLIRESNATLRLEKSQAQTQLADRVKEVEDLHSQLQPLHAKVQELEDIRENLEQELRMTREARERFEQRYHDLINKTDSIDPEDFESLKQKSTALETERDELKQQTESLQADVDSIPVKIEDALKELREQHATSRAKLIEQAKNKNTTQVGKIRELEASLQNAAQEQETLQSQLDATREEAASANQEKAELQSKLQQTGPSKSPQPTPMSNPAEVVALQEQLAQANARSEKSVSEATELHQQLSSAQNRISELEQELAAVRTNLTQNRVVEGAQLQAAIAQPSLNTEQIDKLREELATAQKDADALRVAASVNERAAVVQEGEGQPSIAEQITQQVETIRAELEASHAERVAAADTKATNTIKAMQERLTSRLKEYKATETERLKKEFEEQTERIKQEHRAEVERLQTLHQTETESLKQVTTSATPKKEADGVEELTIVNNLEGVKKFIQSSKIAKDILGSNIKRKIMEFEEKMAQIKSEAETTLEAAVKQARDSAAEMESKRQQVKLNMAQNQLKTAQAKVSLVSTAATKTPEMPVSEVWSAVKDFKPSSAVSGGLAKSTFATSGTSSPATKPPGAAPQPSPRSAAFNASTTNPSAPVGGASIAGQPSAFAASANTAGVNPFAQLAQTSSAAADPFKTSEAHATQNTAAVANSLIGPNTKQEVTNGSAQAEQAVADSEEADKKSDEEPAATGPVRPSSSHGKTLPDAPLSSAPTRGGRRPSQSTLPVPGGRGQQQQRGGIPRGAHGGRGQRGRGSGIPQPGSQGGAFNPGAQQFIPRKRGLEASEHAGPDKRQRGGKS